MHRNRITAALATAGRCANDWHDSAVNCDVPTALHVELGDGDDRATVSWDLAGSLPVTEQGGPGADRRGCRAGVQGPGGKPRVAMTVPGGGAKQATSAVTLTR